MALGVRRLFQADITVATTGIAGPSGGTEEKPVGLVYFAVSGPEGETTVRRMIPARSRELVTARSVATALYLLHRRLEGIPVED
jgi:PncC family amidohydrolase